MQNLHETTFFNFVTWLLQRNIVLTYIERLNNFIISCYLNGAVSSSWRDCNEMLAPS